MVRVARKNRLNIAICTKDRFDSCFSLLRSLEYQVIKDSLHDFIRIIIIDNGSETKHSLMIRKLKPMLKNTLVLNLSFSGLSYSRNMAIALCDEKDFIYFLDDDIKLINPNFLIDLMNLIYQNSPDLIGGPVYAKLPMKKPFWFNPDWLIREYHSDGFGAERLSGGNFGFNLYNVSSELRFDENLGMNGKKVRLGEEKDFVERYLLSNANPRIYYSSKLAVEEEFDVHKLSFIYRMRREFAVGYAGHANHDHEISKKLFSSLFTLSFSDAKKAFSYARVTFSKVFQDMRSSHSPNTAIIFFLALSRSFGFFMRKIRWRI
jgi:glycosyltransferase involved in cell wall biosynthesis